MTVTELTEMERRSVWRALKRPVGQYPYERASQLTGPELLLIGEDDF